MPGVSPRTITLVSAIVRITAIGSLRPDSTSSVEPTRRRKPMPLLRSATNTAAASVDDTIAPSSSACGQSKPSSLRAHGRDTGDAGHTEGRQHAGGRPHAPQRLERRVQPAVEEDEHERRRPDAERQRVVGELDAADAVAPGEHPDGEEDQRDGDRRSLEHPGKNDARHHQDGERREQQG